jgi:methionine biosynthesis protein MetW
MPDIILRTDHLVIAGLITEGASVLDLGCGDGALMGYLESARHARVRGVELDEAAVLKCVSNGLSVSQQDIDAGLSEYGDASFDYVILNQCLQQVKSPHTALAESVRVGRRAIVGFPNFANLSARWQLGVLGRAPITPSLPFQWYDSPNRHFLGVADFRRYCRVNGYNVERTLYLDGAKMIRLLPDILAETGIFVISRNGKGS